MQVETEQSQLESLLDRYLANDLTAGSKVKELRVSLDAAAFFQLTWDVIDKRPSSIALKLLLSLVDIQEVLRRLLELYCQSKERAIAVARKLAISDPRFDANLLHCFKYTDSAKWSDEALLVGLDILDAVSERDRLVLGVSTFLKHHNPKLRSKASLFIARRRPSLSWVGDLSGQTDARIRANIIEGLYGVEEDFVAPLFWKHVTDPNNRVAGNAVLGLYYLGHTDSVQLIEQMARHEDQSFRVTGAWVMGQTGDPRFSIPLAGLLADPDSLVRRQALLALGKIKKALGEVRNSNPLRLEILNYRSDQDGNSLLTTVFENSGGGVRGVRPTDFFLKADGNYVRQYRVQEYLRVPPLEVAFAICLPLGEEIEVEEPFEEAMKRCASQRRPQDTLEIIRLTQEIQLRCFAIHAEESAATLRKALGRIDFGSPDFNLIVVGAASQTRLIEMLMKVGSKFAPTLHVIAVSPEWRTPELREQILNRGGYVRAADPCELAQACFEMYWALRHHYRITWEQSTGSGDLELNVRSDFGTGTAVYQMRSGTAE